MHNILLATKAMSPRNLDLYNLFQAKIITRPSFSMALPSFNVLPHRFLYAISKQFGGNVFWVYIGGERRALDFARSQSKIQAYTVLTLPNIIENDLQAIQDLHYHVIYAINHLSLGLPILVLYLRDSQDTLSLEQFLDLPVHQTVTGLPEGQSFREAFTKTNRSVSDFNPLANFVEFDIYSSLDIQSLIVNHFKIPFQASESNYKLAMLDNIFVQHDTLGIGSDRNRRFIKAVIPQLVAKSIDFRLWLAIGSEAKRDVFYERTSISDRSLYFYLSINELVYDNLVTLSAPMKFSHYQAKLRFERQMHFDFNAAQELSEILGTMDAIIAKEQNSR